MSPLPIEPLLGDIVETLGREGALVLEAPPGAGKTTRVPLALLDVPGLRGQVVVTEPRRLAARLSAERVAHDIGDSVGGKVGYTVRFEDATGPGTRVRYVTEGVLLRRLLADPDLGDVGAVVLDEFHERHLSTDLLLALLRRLRSRRPELRLVVMSATLEAESVAGFLACPRLRSEGRLHPVTIEHAKEADDRPLERQIASALRPLLKAPDGDVLVFLPGAGEIQKARAILEPIATEAGVDVLPLHGDLTLSEQARAVSPGPRPKVILSTNVAESSVTVEGVTAVVDCGLARVAGHSPWSGVPTLELRKISRASAVQRAGRAGRVRPGRVFRLYTRGDFESRPEHDKPEIARLDLTEMLLVLHGGGVARPEEIEWLDAPPAAAVTAAETLLQRLRAVDRDGGLTATGRRMLELPLPPRLARLVVAGESSGIAERAALAAALLSERDIRLAARVRFGAGPGLSETAFTGPSDVLELMERFDEAAESNFKGERFRAMDLDRRATLAVAEMHRRLSRQVRDAGEGPYDGAEEERRLLRALLAAYPDRVARRRAEGRRDLVLASGSVAELSEGSVVRNAPFLLALDAEERGGRSRTTVVRLASAIEPDWMLEDHDELVSMDEHLEWNPKTRAVESVSRITTGSVVLDEDRRRASPSAAASELLARAARDAGLDRDPGLLSLLQRLDLARHHLPEEDWPELGDETIGAALERVCAGKTSLDELGEGTLGSELYGGLTPSQQRLLKTEVPERLTLPGGRSVPVVYEPGKPPSVSSRLQDFFGMTRTPRLCRGRVPLTLHLLAPNQRAVQVTQDLEGFWDRHYPAIRRELCRRYPRHPWPEDGKTATPPPPRGRR